MDPDASLIELRVMCSRDDSDGHEYTKALFRALDGWLSKGGALPKEWADITRSKRHVEDSEKWS